MNSKNKQVLDIIRHSLLNDIAMDIPIMNIAAQAALVGAHSVLEKIIDSEYYDPEWNDVVIEQSLKRSDKRTFFFLLKKLKDQKVFHGSSLESIDQAINDLDFIVFKALLFNFCRHRYDEYDIEQVLGRVFCFKYTLNARDTKKVEKHGVHVDFQDNGLPHITSDLGSHLTNFPLKSLKKSLRNHKHKIFIRSIIEDFGYYEPRASIEIVDAAYDCQLLNVMPDLSRVSSDFLRQCLKYFKLSPLTYLQSLGQTNPQRTIILGIIANP
jgi:hypothetical protein